MILILMLLLLQSTFFEMCKARPFVKIQKQEMGNLEEVFVHLGAWFNICDFAYIPHGDAWAPGVSNFQPSNPENIPAGSLVFVTPYGIERFLSEVHPTIKNPYILVTLYYGPVCAVKEYVNDPKIIAWFGQANRDAITYEKFTLIPLGVFRDETVFQRRGQFNEIFKQYRQSQKPKPLYMNFVIHEGRGGETEYRRAVYDIFKHKPFCTVGTPKPFANYIDETAQCKFVVSPTGDMVDCYRHWEALVVGSIPIVHRSPLDAAFEDLPVVIVDDYKDVTQEFLNRKYEEIQHKTYNLRKLYMQYWVDKINAARTNFLKS